MTTEQQSEEQQSDELYGGTIHFLGVRASFARAKELLAATLDEDISPAEWTVLREEIQAFLAQFEEPNPE